MSGLVFVRRKREMRRQAVIAGLSALKREFPNPIDRTYINDMLLYAEVGRDRYSLDASYVDKTRANLEDHAWASSV